jgi:CPA2 family monovalent cation:H+ antiporter-2
VITLGLGIGYLSHLLGLPYALGAFVAGLVLSESEYGHQALSDVIPLRDLFGLLFFASVGILFDPGYLLAHAREVSVLVVAVLLGKGLLFGLITRAFGLRHIVPLATALTMGQIGEFSFLLAQVGRQSGAVGDDLLGLVVSTAVITMILTPYLARLAGPIYRLRRRGPGSPAGSFDPDFVAPDRPVVVAGAGRVGRSLARILTAQDIPLVLVEFDQRRAQDARSAGWRVVFGDASQGPVLRAAGIERARLALITVPVAVDSLAVTARVRDLAPEVPILVRTDTLEEVDSLRELGVLHVIQPEFEAALEMAREALVALGIDGSAAARAVADERARG